jgi:prephenate dehydrogenase
MKTLGIVGWSPFNELLARKLAPHFAGPVLIASRTQSEGTAGEHGRFAPLNEVLQSDVVIPSIPSQFLPEFLKENAGHIKSGALVVDVCSVKVKPVKALLELLPENVDILSTHPLFGPGSALNGLEGHRILTYPTRIPNERYESIKRFLTDSFGLKVIEKTPEEHDKAMAYVLGLTQSIGRASQTLDIPETPLSTTAYDDMLDMKRIQGNDSWELFESIMIENPYALETLDEFIHTMQGLRNKLK